MTLSVNWQFGQGMPAPHPAVLPVGSRDALRALLVAIRQCSAVGEPLLQVSHGGEHVKVMCGHRPQIPMHDWIEVQPLLRRLGMLVEETRQPYLRWLPGWCFSGWTVSWPPQFAVSPGGAAGNADLIEQLLDSL